MSEELLVAAEWQLVDSAEHECVREILDTDRFFLVKVVGILHLRLTGVGIWQSTVGIVDVLGKGV